LKTEVERPVVKPLGDPKVDEEASLHHRAKYDEANPSKETSMARSNHLK
jgi:hypothetical protein